MVRLSGVKSERAAARINGDAVDVLISFDGWMQRSRNLVLSYRSNQITSNQTLSSSTQIARSTHGHLFPLLDVLCAFLTPDSPPSLHLFLCKQARASPGRRTRAQGDAWGPACGAALPWGLRVVPAGIVSAVYRADHISAPRTCPSPSSGASRRFG
jgi:hypothetical protein